VFKGFIGISENIRAISKKVRGLFRIKFIWLKGFVLEYSKREGLFCKKRLKSGRVL